MKESDRIDRRQWILLITFFAMFIITYFGARWSLKNVEMVRWVRITVAILPVPFFALALFVMMQGIRRMDELQRRIQLEALAIAYPLGILLLMTLGLLQRAIELSFEDWSYAHIWPYFTTLYFLGLVIAGRRYQ